jgi:hypothetical protein
VQRGPMPHSWQGRITSVEGSEYAADDRCRDHAMGERSFRRTPPSSVNASRPWVRERGAKNRQSRSRGARAFAVHMWPRAESSPTRSRSEAVGFVPLAFRWEDR